MKRQRTRYVKWDDIPGELPKATVPADTNLDVVAQKAVLKLNNFQLDSLTAGVLWRDIVSFTGTYRTFYSRPKVYEKFQKLSHERSRSVFRLKGTDPRRKGSLGDGSWVDVDVLFNVQHGTLVGGCKGIVSVVPCPDGRWRIWMLRTWLECFDGYGHPDILEPNKQLTSGQMNGVTSGDNSYESRVEEYMAAIVGGGQAGLSLAGRLQALAVKYLLIEKHVQVGDVWAKRYESFRRHTTEEFGHLPFERTYPPEDDITLPGKRIGAGHKVWSEKYGINVRTSTTVDRATWDEAAQKWTVETSGPDGKHMVTAQDLVLAIGPGATTPVIPDWTTPARVKASGFKGDIMHAPAEYQSCHQWAGKRGVVVGTANTGYDVAEDMANAHMETTILQRSPTFVFPAEWLHYADNIHYNTGKLTEISDRESFTYPNKINRAIVNDNVHRLIRMNPERFDALEKVGFKLERFADLLDDMYVRFGGHYVDVGCSGRIVRGEIKVKGQPVKSLTENGILFEDGSELGADLIVLCTGFDHDFRTDAGNIVGRDVVEQMDDYWGMDAEGELRGHAKFAGHPHLFYFGGDARMARWYSRFIALQIQAKVLRKPLKLYLD